MGESGANIYVIGSPELDIHMQPSGVSLDEVRERYEIPYPEYGICVFHPVTSEVGTIGRQAEALFGSLSRSGRCFVVIAPNNDPGSDAVFAAIENLPRDRFRVLPSMRFRHFSELMKNAAVFVGNSSAGVREVPFLGIPSLDLGTRQSKRAMSENVVNCGAEDDAAIQGFLVNAWGKRMHRHGGFGSGNAAARFVELLNAGAFWTTPLQKNFVDHG
jgi:UDP-N-acetylglucosamine 2-epimerase (hydrolysing)